MLWGFKERTQKTEINMHDNQIEKGKYTKCKREEIPFYIQTWKSMNQESKLFNKST